MANTYFLKLICTYAKGHDELIGTVEYLKVGECFLKDTSKYTYYLTSYGENLNTFWEKYPYETNWQIAGTKNIIGICYNEMVGGAYFTLPKLYTDAGNYWGELSGGGGVANPIYGSMLIYEPNYKLLLGSTYYSVRITQTANNIITFQQYDVPYTLPVEYKEESIGGFIYQTPSARDRCNGSYLKFCIDAINAGNFNDDYMKQKPLYESWPYHILKNYDNEESEPTEEPFYIEYGFPGKPSKPQGGDGSMKDTNEPVALTPSDVTNVVYPVRCYRLSKANVSALHGYLWSNDFITNLPKLFSDPFSAIVGIQAIPYISPQNESNVIIGTLDTNIVANRVSIYYVTIDLGSINVTEYWQNFLDYQPYTRLKLFLPYIGIVDLPTDLFMNNSVSVKYRIDIISGACVAIVSNSENIICTFTGNCSTKIPLSNNDHSNAIGNTLVGIAGYAATGNTVAAVANTASIVVGSKERIQISGSLSTAHGILINDKPFLMIERPDTEIPENYAGLKGYTSNISMKLSETSGFTKISDIKLDGLSCTDAEKEELLNMMQNGIYL